MTIPEQSLILPIVNCGHCVDIISSIRPIEINGFNIYPNPTFGTIIIQLEGNGKTTNGICNALGGVVDRYEETREEKHELCLEEPAGIYFVTIQTESKTYTKRLLLVN